MNSAKKQNPIEVTTQNIYFHEDSPILSIDIQNDQLATCGFDGILRLWNLKFKKMNYEEDVYRTAANSSIEIEHLKDLTGFSKPVNCIRFCRLNLENQFILAACADGGKIILFTNDKSYIVPNGIDSDAYDMCWYNNLLYIAFGNGTVSCYRVDIEEDIDFNIIEDDIIKDSIKLNFNLIFSQKIHDNTIQGISYNEKYNLLATFSLDKTVKIHFVEKNGLKFINSLDEKIDNSRGLFKRILFEEDLLYIFTKSNAVSIYTYHFKSKCLYKKIGSLNSSVVKVLTGNINNENILLICTKKGAYILKNDNLVCLVDNACYMAITDAVIYRNTVFLGSMDGFITTIRFS